MRRDWDYKNTMDYAIAQGHAEGHAQGKEEGIAEGLVKGKAEGLAEGQLAIARRMLAEGLSPEIVSKCTELSAEQVRALAEEPVQK